MNNQQFFNSFRFLKYSYTRCKHTDNATAHGAPTNYIGRLIHGSGKLVTKDKTVFLQENDIVFIPKDCRYHSYWSTNRDSQLEWDSIGFDYFPQNDSSNYPLQKITPDPIAMEYLQRITGSLRVTQESVGWLYLFLGRVLPQMEAIRTHNAELIRQAEGLLWRNPSLKISQVAQLCGVSESGLFNCFKRDLGITPNALRQKLLCEKAEELLITTGLSVEEISSKLGFSSASYFRKILCKHTGKTPRQIRQSAKQI